MCRTGWALVSGEWDEQQKIGRCVEDPSRQQRPEMDKRKKRRSYLEIIGKFGAAGVARIHRDAHVAVRVELQFGALKYEVFDVPLHRTDDA